MMGQGVQRFGRIILVAFSVIMVLFAARPALAWDDLDVQTWLNEPGVKLLAVEFYATWCEPCQAAIPKWKALQEKYRSKGLRLVVVSVQSEGACSRPEWMPDRVVCDYDGQLTNHWKAGNLPQAFLWSWQGNLLVSHGSVEEVEKQIELYFSGAPRILVDTPKDLSGQKLPKNKSNEIYGLVRSELKRAAKFDLVASDDERKKLRLLKQKSFDPRYAEEGQCTVGEEVSANSMLTITYSERQSGDRLRLELFSAEKGCLTAAAWAPVINGDLEAAVIEAVAKLVRQLHRPAVLPHRSAPSAHAVASVPAPAPAQPAAPPAPAVDPDNPFAEYVSGGSAAEQHWAKLKEIVINKEIPFEKRLAATRAFKDMHPDYEPALIAAIMKALGQHKNPPANIENFHELYLVEDATGKYHGDWWEMYQKYPEGAPSFFKYSYDKHKRIRNIGIGLFVTGMVMDVIASVLLPVAIEKASTCDDYGNCDEESGAGEGITALVFFPIGGVLWITGASMWGVHAKRVRDMNKIGPEGMLAEGPYLIDEPLTLQFTGVGPLVANEDGARGFSLRFEW